MTATREERVKEFREAGDSPNFNSLDDDYLEKINNVQLIMTCIAEEVSEFFEAAQNYTLASNEETRAQLCKEWADVQYVVSQAAVFFDIPADEAFKRVADNNMTKVVDGKLVKREDGKILKPEGYEPADMKGL